MTGVEASETEREAVAPARPRSRQTAGGGVHSAAAAAGSGGGGGDELCQRVSEPKESTAMSERIHWV